MMAPLSPHKKNDTKRKIALDKILKLVKFRTNEKEFQGWLKEVAEAPYNAFAEHFAQSLAFSRIDVKNLLWNWS